MEIWDLYDYSGNKLNRTAIRGQKINKCEYHIVVHVIIKNSIGEYLIQKRSDTKDLWPGLWAFTGGAALSGETSEEAALRELKEETGISLDIGDLELVDRLVFNDYFCDIWYSEADENLDELEFQEAEVTALDYKSKVEIKEMISKGIFHTYSNDYFNTVFRC